MACRSCIVPHYCERNGPACQETAMDCERRPRVAALIRAASDLAIHLEYETLTPAGQDKHAALMQALSGVYDDMVLAGLAPEVA